MKKTLIIIFSIIFCLLIGFVSSRIQTSALLEWYPTLNKSPLTPPNYVFPIVWTILYVFMGISIGLVINGKLLKEGFFVRLFAAQIILNFLWSILFFYMNNPLLGFIDIILLDIVLIVYAVKTYSSAKISSILFVPYIIWVTFAAYLNLYVMLYN